MDDVQTEAELPVENEVPESAPGEAESADDNAQEAAEEKVVFDERQQAKVNELIGEKVAKTHEERNRGDALQQRLDEIEAAQPKPLAPEIPPMPDTDLLLDDPAKYNADIAVREKAITERAVFDANQDFLTRQDERAAFDTKQKRAVEARRTFDTYHETGKSFGIDREKVQQDATTVGNSLRNPDVQDFIATDPQGPLITNYLVGNLAELDLISRMSPMQAATHIATKIRPKLSGARQSTSAPKPPGIVDGSGSPAKERGPKGATFE